ncbi:DUF4244 domain-containing protein [Actinophytocola sp.]|jgi:uncharacterized protein DUF4244|uniref:DUF4244 domain-containing protein n=1 Tax=Actinophytocola sp. TaxID=1872138 RepID=UPI002D6F0956|nr:DUF4244 domain-containing protein [Actinophytocola sp.]HYQ61886.1 DUF4244 domain-containing protein [Actinophytocola sp.]
MFNLSREVFLDDTGSTTEAGIIMVALASFAAMFLMVVTSDPVKAALAALVQRAVHSGG